MLPLIKININEVYQISEDLMEPGKTNITVQTFAYDYKEFLNGLVAHNENADIFLSKSILSGIMKKQFKNKILFFYSPYSEYTFISAALVKLNTNLTWLSIIPGYCEYGQEYLKPNARPFLYWDGNNLHRIYHLSNYDPTSRYITDFGSLYGLSSTETDEDTYNRIRLNENNKTWDYSIVPDTHEEIVSIKDKKLVLLHSRYSLSNKLEL